MPTARITLSALWADQGMAHMLQTFDDETTATPSGIALFDFGTHVTGRMTLERTVGHRTFTTKSAPSVNAVLEALLAQLAAGQPPKIDYVVISHQDNDHWSFLYCLMQAIAEMELPVCIGRVIWGGREWNSYGVTLRDYLKLRCCEADPDCVGPFVENDSAYSAYQCSDGPLDVYELERFGELGDVSLRTLYVNLPTAQTSDMSSVRNASSAVVVIDFWEQRMILPGDATWETLQAINNVLAEWGDDNPLKPVRMMSVPHHGAIATMRQSGEEMSVLQEFIGIYTEPERVVASAGVRNHYGHPDKRVMNQMAARAIPSRIGNPPTTHPLVVYSARDERLIVEQSDIAKYTTVLSLDSPALAAHYLFSLSTAGFFTDWQRFSGVARPLDDVPASSPSLPPGSLSSSSAAGPLHEKEEEVYPTAMLQRGTWSHSLPDRQRPSSQPPARRVRPGPLNRQ